MIVGTLPQIEVLRRAKQDVEEVRKSQSFTTDDNLIKAECAIEAKLGELYLQAGREAADEYERRPRPASHV